MSYIRFMIKLIENVNVERTRTLATRTWDYVSHAKKILYKFHHPSSLILFCKSLSNLIAK